MKLLVIDSLIYYVSIGYQDPNCWILYNMVNIPLLLLLSTSPIVFCLTKWVQKSKTLFFNQDDVTVKQMLTCKLFLAR